MVGLAQSHPSVCWGAIGNRMRRPNRRDDRSVRVLIFRPDRSSVGRVICWRSAAEREVMGHLFGGRLRPCSRRVGRRRTRWEDPLCQLVESCWWKRDVRSSSGGCDGAERSVGGQVSTFGPPFFVLARRDVQLVGWHTLCVRFFSVTAGVPLSGLADVRGASTTSGPDPIVPEARPHAKLGRATCKSTFVSSTAAHSTCAPLIGLRVGSMGHAPAAPRTAERLGSPHPPAGRGSAACLPSASAARTRTRSPARPPCHRRC